MFKLKLNKLEAQNLLYALDTSIKNLDTESPNYDKYSEELEALRDSVERQLGLSGGEPLV